MVYHPETTLAHEPVTSSSSLRARHLKEQLSNEFAVPVSIQAGCLPLLSHSIKLLSVCSARQYSNLKKEFKYELYLIQ